jgi:pyruvate dehydrogenase E2 component (dihydrolipoamide acetyltransferase)
MAIPITIPRLGWNMEHGVFGGWLKKDGEAVRAGEAVFVLETDKATENVESLDNGILNIVPNAPTTGATVAVGLVIGYLLKSGESAPTPEERKASSSPVRKAEEVETKRVAVPERSRAQPAISPRARRAANRLGIDWTQLVGSGRTGRIRERDVLRESLPESGRGGKESFSPVRFGEGFFGLRKIIAERMSASHLTTAPVTLIAAVDATALVQLRSELKRACVAAPSYSDIVIKLTAEALQQHPALNARWDNGRVVTVSEIHIGLAVETPAGLVVPVVRDIPKLNLADVAVRTHDLIERARERKLSVQEISGGTFTVSNLGSYGVDAFTPIINHPECAVLGLGRIQKQPVVIDDQIVIREQMTLSLTFDHRIVDGAPAARFLRTLRELIESCSNQGATR